MRYRTIWLAALAAVALSGCMWNDVERATAGGLGGLALASVVGGPIVAAAAIGAGAGALCDDLNFELCY